jgi:HAD superfamily hydrolase (TIGR01450 family)
MIGIILAAGVGSRLRPMTNTKPKCLVTTAGKPILQYQIDAYKEAGIGELLIIVGYEGGAIREFCKHIKDIKINIIENPDYEMTNNMYSLYLAKKHLADRNFILNNADLSIDSSIVKKLLEHESENAIVVDTSIFNVESMKISLNNNGYISDIAKNIQEDKSFACSTDFYKFSKSAGKVFFEEITRIIEEEENLKDWTEVAMQRLFQEEKLSDFEPCNIAGLDWVEIDNYEDLALSDRVFSKLDQTMNNIDNILCDLDGTIYVGSNEIQGAGDAISRLQKKGKNIYFLSNNSSKNKSAYVERLQSLGIETDISKIVISTDALVDYLKNERVDKIHVLGTNNLKKSLLDEGFQIDSVTPEYVVVGYDTELNYQKLITACKYINDGVDILATHSDIFCPSEHGPIPDIGATLKMLELTTGKFPQKTFGKPGPEIVRLLSKKYDLNPEKTVIIGDRLHTDILMSKNIPCFGLLVLTGEYSRDQLEGSDIQPDFVINSIADL